MKTQQPDTRKHQQSKSMAQRIREMAKSGLQDRANSGAKISGFAKIDPAERYKWVAQAAYFRAERRGFVSGGELQDWLDAEAEIRQLLGQ